MSHAIVAGVYKTHNWCYCFHFQANLSNQEVSSAEFVRVVMTSVCLSTVDVRKWPSSKKKANSDQNPAATFRTEVRGFVVPGGVHQLNGSKVIQRSEILKKFLNSGHKQREALKALQSLKEQTELPNSQSLSSLRPLAHVHYPSEGGGLCDSRCLGVCEINNFKL